MNALPIIYRDGHLFVEIGRELWLFDTGAPVSFGTSCGLTIADEHFSIESNYMGLDVATLTQFTGVPCAGLLGSDIFGRFDHLLDVDSGTLTISTDELSHSGQRLSMAEFMGIPIVTAWIAGKEYRMFFDTGAQISYFQGDTLSDFPAAGQVTDFYPGFGQFQTDTHEVAILLGGNPFTVRCGRLPSLLGMSLMMADTQGIVGNEVLCGRTVGYFPRRGVLCL